VTEKDRQVLIDYIDLFATPLGQRVLENMKQHAGFYWTNVKKGLPIEQTRLIWHEAQRAFVLEVAARAAYDFFKEPVEDKENDNG
jgi:hypothetical protein